MSGAAGVLVLQHQDDAPAGLLLDVLDAREVQWRVVRVDRGEPLPDPGTVAVAVSLGSDESVGDSGIPWIARELAWLRAVDAQGSAILGLCFGAQALSVALGGGAGRAGLPERGWIQVQSADVSLIAPGPWQGWHYDTIELPAGAELLAHNSSGVQAFRFGSHLGVQFHPEATLEIVRGWAVKHARGPHGPVSPAAYSPGRDFEQAAVNARQLLDTYLSSVLPSTTPKEQVIHR